MKDKAITIKFILNNTTKSVALEFQFKPSIAFFDILIRIIKEGRITGKLSRAIREVVLSALEAIPATSVRVAENPKAPKSEATIYCPRS